MANAQKAAFFEKYAPIAVEQQQKYGIPASVTLAQMYIESGGGTSRLAVEGNNFFGIKCSREWLAAGKPYSLHNDDKPNEKFCNYASVEDSVRHHSQVLMGSRYAKCRQCASDDYRGWATGLQAAGYATDRRYASTLVREIEAYDLQKYDKQAIRTATQPIGYARGEKVDIAGGRPQAAVAASEDIIAPATYSYPVDGNLTVTSLYGSRDAPTAGASTNHKGIDISVPTATAVRATEAGTVVAVKCDLTEHDSTSVRMQDSNKGGNYVVVEYPRANGTSYFVSYGHLTENGVKVNVGDKVEAGQVIGLSGATGNGTGPHLHMAVKTGPTGGTERKDKTHIDPLDYLAEISVRGSINASVTRNGKDLLAGRLTDVDITPTPYEVLLAQQGGNGLTPEQRQNAEDGSRLAAESGSNDQKNWLAYLMGQNNDQQQGGDLISNLISTLFMSTMLLAMKLDHSGKGSSQNVAAVPQQQQQPETEEQRNAAVVRRERDSIDADKAHEFAAMNYDTLCPEHHSQGQGQRLA